MGYWFHIFETYFSFVKLLSLKLVELMIRVDPESTLKSDITIRADVALECCADSCAAMARLIRYVSAEGDFQSEFESSSGNTTSSSVSKSEDTADEDNTITDASEMKTSSTVIETSLNKMELSDISNSGSQSSVKLDLLDAMDDDDFLVDSRKPTRKTTTDSFENDFEDDFVDLEAEPGIGWLKSGTSLPTLRRFSSFDIRENHFRLPFERKDKLNPPVDFPRAEQRIFLKELNIQWKMFAGVDFPIAFEPMRMDRTIQAMQMPRSKSQRDSKSMVELSINKFRLRYETFQNDKIQTRIALTLDELEILDRLEASNINKLLHRKNFRLM